MGMGMGKGKGKGQGMGMAVQVVLVVLMILVRVSSNPVQAEEAKEELKEVAERRTFIVRVDPDAKPSIFTSHLQWYHSTLLSVCDDDDDDDDNLELEKLEEDSHSPTYYSIIHTYQHVFHGFSVSGLSTRAAHRLSSLPHVLALIPEQIRSLHTTHSPQFLGLNIRSGSGLLLLKESDFGSDVIIGVIDTGIWPHRRSFHDRGLGPVPSKWKGPPISTCNQHNDYYCNRKVIGSTFFCQGYEAINGPVNDSSTGGTEFRSPLDSDGHGTHTASIAAGRYVSHASALGYARGVAAGMAPKARLAIYKVCWGGGGAGAGGAGGCYDSDILRAFDAAVADGVDVISLSVGGAVVPYHLDAIAIAAFSASAERGIFVSASAGNGGPGGLSVTNVAPWMTTVGAGSIDRDFPADVVLGDGRVVQGVSVYGGPAFPKGKKYPLVYSSASSTSCYCLEGSLTPKQVKGKIVLCDRGINSRSDKGEAVKKAGGVGMIIANGVFDGEGLVADCHVLPAISVIAANGQLIKNYIISAANSHSRSSNNNNNNKSASATILFRGTRLGVKPAPTVASFSARGPNPQTPEIIKPDVIAPGLNILAAWPDGVGPAGIQADKRRTEFNILSGTSMACPHVSGLAALLKAAHPDWSPAAIRSALMTTAYTKTTSDGQIIRDEATGNASTLMDFGSGHVRPQKAMDPGLVYDISLHDYIDFLCNSNYTVQNIRAITHITTKSKYTTFFSSCNNNKKTTTTTHHVANLNYPSLSVVFLLDHHHHQQEDTSSKSSNSIILSTHFIRTVTNVGPPNSLYKVEVSMLPTTLSSSINVTVDPEKLSFRRTGQKLSFLVRVEAHQHNYYYLSPGDSRVETGSVVWSDANNKHVVTTPLLVTMQQPLLD